MTENINIILIHGLNLHFHINCNFTECKLPQWTVPILYVTVANGKKEGYPASLGIVNSCPKHSETAILSIKWSPESNLSLK